MTEARVRFPTEDKALVGLSGARMRIGRPNRVDHVSSERRSEIMRSVRNENTGAELAVRRVLFRLGYRYRLHRRDLPGSPDIVFLSRRKTIFVHGCFWHGHECSRGNLPSSNVDFWQAKIQRNRERDSRSEKQLRKDGWEVLTVWECEMKNDAALVKRVCRFLGKDRNDKRSNKESFSA